MSVAISSQNINVDTLSNIDIDKQYYLSKSGDIKEASGWMKFKCWLGCSGARQKVANLINAVRDKLLENAGMEIGTNDAELEDNIRTIKRDKMVSGEDLWNLATKFAKAQPEAIAKKTAERMIAEGAKEYVPVMMANHKLGAENSAGLEKLIQHGLKRLLANPQNQNPLPIVKGADSIQRLDRKTFESKMSTALFSVRQEISEILCQIKGVCPLDEDCAQRIINGLYTQDGRRNDVSVESLFAPIEEKKVES